MFLGVHFGGHRLLFLLLKLVWYDVFRKLVAIPASIFLLDMDQKLTHHGPLNGLVNYQKTPQSLPKLPKRGILINPFTPLVLVSGVFLNETCSF